MFKRIFFTLLQCLLIITPVQDAFAEVLVPIRVGDITIFVPVNASPVAVDDHFEFPEQHGNFQMVTVGQGSEATQELQYLENSRFDLDILANDSDQSLSTVSIEIVTPLSNANHALVVDGTSVQFTPQHGGFTGRDTFEYRLIDENGAASQVARVVIDMLEANDPPELSTDYVAVVEDGQWCNKEKANDFNCRLRIRAFDNDFDPEGGQLTFTRYETDHPNPGPGDYGYVYDTQTLGGLIKRIGNEFEYVPGTLFFEAYRRSDRFYYYMKDSEGLERRGLVAIGFNGLPNQKPEVASVNFKSGSIFSERDPVSIGVFASDDQGIDRVEYRKSNESQWKTANPNGDGTYQLFSDVFSVNKHVFYVRALDDDFEASDELRLEFTVVADQPPSLTILSPSSGVEFEQSTFFTVRVAAQDDGIISEVKGRVGGQPWVMGSQYNNDYVLTLDAGSVGEGKALTVQAIDDAGQASEQTILFNVVDRPVFPSPQVVTFAWVPDAIRVGGAASLSWDISNIQSCSEVLGDGTTVAKSGTSGSEPLADIKLPGAYTTQWVCTDLNGQRYPLTGYLEAQLTIEKLPAPAAVDVQ